MRASCRMAVLSAATVTLLGLIQTGHTECSFKVVVKYSVADVQLDSLGNEHVDSLARFLPIGVTIFRSATDYSRYADTTNDSGFVVAPFNTWADGASVVAESVVRMSLDFPGTNRVPDGVTTTTFEPLVIDSVSFLNKPNGIVVLLPLITHREVFTIGSGVPVFSFAVLNDMHCGGSVAGHYGNGVPEGWDGDTVTGQADVNSTEDSAIVAEINQGALPAFAVALGDLAQRSEKAEYEKARSILDQLKVPYIPMLGNHDTRPYDDDNGSGHEAPMPPWRYGEMFDSLFGGELDSLVPLEFPSWNVGGYFPPQEAYSPLQSFYFNSAFNYQGYGFIDLDYNSRSHALWPFGINGTLPNAYPDDPSFLLSWLATNVARDDSNGRRLICLCHQPLTTPYVVTYPYCFSHYSRDLIGDNGLTNHRPLAQWIGGHVHGSAHWPLDTTAPITYALKTNSTTDTVARALTLNRACLQGWYGWFDVYDSVAAYITGPSTYGSPYTPGSIRAENVYFSSSFGYIGNNAPLCNWWYFGDGTCSGGQNTLHTFNMNGAYDTLYKVTLSESTCSGRVVTVSKLLHVCSAFAPMNLRLGWVWRDQQAYIQWQDITGSRKCLTVVYTAA